MSWPARTLLMIRPRSFGFNPETAQTNPFQQDCSSDESDTALKEFDTAVATLRQAGLQIILADDQHKSLPDAIFPNNWFSTHPDGSVFIYPMYAPVRRKEKRKDLFETLLPAAGFQINHIYDLSYFEKQNLFLEGTGSMVVDHSHRMIYACRSPRTHAEPLQCVAERLNCDYLMFDAQLDGKPLYHTNMMLSIGKELAVICTEIIDSSCRHLIRDQLARHHVLLEITIPQLRNMAGNVLLVQNHQGESLCILSSTAMAALSERQIQLLQRYARPVICHIPTIEKIGGGSIRCMLAEILLPAC
jgi:hypothetical protein